METALQQRIVGAVVLVALGVIFIPALLDGSGYKSRHTRTIEIPAKPVIPPMDARAAPEPTPIDDRLTALEQEQSQSKEPASDLVSWMLQVGTFQSRDNAEGYRDELREKGYTTHVVEDKDGDKTSYKVRIGPEVEKSRIEALKAKLDKQKIDSYIVEDR